MKIKVALFAALLLLLLFACEEKPQLPEEKPCSHVWSDNYSVTAPTVSDEGARVYTCVLCGEKKESEIPKLSEKDYFIIKTEPKCEEEGKYVYTSEEWGEYEVTLAPIGHLFPDKPNRNTATCTEDGEDIYVCGRCGAEKKTEVKALGHDYATYVYEGSCIEKGYTEYVCRRCGVVYKANETDYVHDFEAGEHVPGSCTEKGYTPYVCRRCGTTEKKEDDYVHVYNKDTGRCSLCDAACAHSFDNYVCTVCGFDIRAELTERSGAYEYNDVVYFGTYPQSHVSDPTLIAALDEAFSIGTGDKRTVLGISYARANVKEQSNRVYSFSDGTSMSTLGGREIHYFRYDPIAWRKAKGGVLVADCILDTGVFQDKNNITTTGSVYFYDRENEIYANDWSVSAVRKFLAEDFYEKAFNEKQKAMIVAKDNDNRQSGYYKPDSERPWCDRENTVDNVFLPSFADLYDEDDATDEINEDLIRVLSDYALCSSVRIEGGEEKTAKWYLRSPGLYSSMICAVEHDGKLNVLTPVYKEKELKGTITVEKTGIVPAIMIIMPE